MKKGQGAMEYLMTYGWALLVIVIVAGALFALGVLNPATYQQKRCTGFQYLTYADHKLNTTGFVAQVRNSNQRIAISSIKVGSAATHNSPVVSDSDIREGDSFTIPPSPIPSVTAGTAFNYAVEIGYSVTGGISGQKDIATCIGTVA